MRKKDEIKNHYFTAHPRSKPKLGVIRTHFRGRPFEFLTASGVFSVRRIDSGTRLLIESMVLPQKGWILDVGCGYGSVGIAAAVFNPDLRVIMVDVNERAIWLARQNVEINDVSNIEVRRGNLYEPIKKSTFNGVLSNPPVSAGMETVRAIIVEAPKHMTDKAIFQMVVRSKIGGKRLRMLLESAFGNVQVLARKSGYRVFISEKQ
jgi:16S rRNA (guanine1207-N2)-methyltransferase